MIGRPAESMERWDLGITPASSLTSPNTYTRSKMKALLAAEKAGYPHVSRHFRRGCVTAHAWRFRYTGELRAHHA
jgi:hypothetical protein